MQDPYCHSSSIAIERPADMAFEIMSQGIKQGQWTWGSLNRSEVAPGIFMGRSVFTGKEAYVRLSVDEARMTVDYDVGGSPDSMRFRNMSRVIPGPVLDLPPDHCVVTLLTWRLSTQTDQQWQQTSCIHEAEMFLIKGLLER